MQKPRAMDEAAGQGGTSRESKRRAAGSAPVEAMPRDGGGARKSVRGAESARQREIFEARREEILARHPGRHIAVCAGEVFDGATAEEAVRGAWLAHDGRALFVHSPDCASGGRAPPGTAPEEAKARREEAARTAEGKAESARQREIFEARREEILARHPGRHIAVCAGEVFDGATAEEAARRAWRAHGFRAAFFYVPGCPIADMWA